MNLIKKLVSRFKKQRLNTTVKELTLTPDATSLDVRRLAHGFIEVGAHTGDQSMVETGYTMLQKISGGNR